MLLVVLFINGKGGQSKVAFREGSGWGMGGGEGILSFGHPPSPFEGWAGYMWHTQLQPPPHCLFMVAHFNQKWY